jgi:hypothetical protein
LRELGLVVGERALEAVELVQMDDGHDHDDEEEDAADHRGLDGLLFLPRSGEQLDGD